MGHVDRHIIPRFGSARHFRSDGHEDPEGAGSQWMRHPRVLLFEVCGGIERMLLELLKVDFRHIGIGIGKPLKTESRFHMLPL